MVNYATVFGYVACNRMPFVSVEGLVGLGPDTMISSDKIFIIMGHTTPVILRDAGGGSYSIVGDAYVYGIMDGEFMERHSDLEDIVIV